jgi:glycosyltransferase involved in cell wall biosynthesis
MRPCILIPAFQAEQSLQSVVHGLRQEGLDLHIIVVDDGSTDETAVIARTLGVRLVRHGYNRGKGAALRTGLAVARDAGFDAMVSVDADGQHPPAAVRRVLEAEADDARATLVLGVRDLAGAGAPRKNQISNGISNFFLSWFSGKRLADTQCGLRRYPVAETLALKARADGYAWEAEVVLRAVRAGVRVIELPVDVYYPPESERVTHFDSVKDPARIVVAVVRTMVTPRP